ncbi:MAG: hypothetical protein FWE70_07680, partial [Oscillospiraceae bacterium]|nr:hypothetical protein [Oscillospiraceae bacterium]
MDAETLRSGMLKGYNTYHSNSVLTHVLMPHGFAIGCGFRFHNKARVLRDSLIGRFGDHEEKVRPYPRTYDGSYTELTLDCCGHSMLIRTASKGDGLLMVVSPLA